MALLDRVLARLRAEFNNPDRTALFEALQPFLAAKEGGDTYAAVAARLGRSEEAVKKTVQRMRRRYQALLDEEIAKTVSTAEEVAEELRHLYEIMSRT